MSISKKIVLLGHFGVGKTSIIRRFVEDEFSTDYKVTIGVHILKKEVLLPNDNSVSLILWDIEGTEDITQINKSYLLGASAFIFTYDITRPSTYKNLNIQLKGLETNFPSSLLKVIGNKVDLIPKSDFTNDKNTEILKKTHYLTSAKTGENIETLFVELASYFTK